MRVLALAAVAALPLAYYACQAAAQPRQVNTASEAPRARASGDTKSRSIAPRIRRMPARPHERLSVTFERKADSEAQAQMRAIMVREWTAFRAKAGMTPEQERAVLAAVYDMSQELQRVTDDEIAAGYEPVNVGKLRGEAAHAKASDLLDEREAQLAEVAASALDIAAAGLMARLQEILTPDQLASWTLAPPEVDTVRDFVTVAE
jgi:hypothetical protein